MFYYYRIIIFESFHFTNICTTDGLVAHPISPLISYFDRGIFEILVKYCFYLSTNILSIDLNGIRQTFSRLLWKFLVVKACIACILRNILVFESVRRSSHEIMCRKSKMSTRSGISSNLTYLSNIFVFTCYFMDYFVYELAIPTTARSGNPLIMLNFPCTDVRIVGSKAIVGVHMHS